MRNEERDFNKLKIEGKDVDEASSSIFRLADCYNHEPDRYDYELNEAGLRKKVKSILEKFNLL